MAKCKINSWMVAFFCLFGVLVGAGGVYAAVKYQWFDQASRGGDSAAVKEIKKVDFDFNNVAALGNESAQTTIVEFSDFQCSACGAFSTQVFPQLKAKYIDTGKVRFIVKDFPLFNRHPQAVQAAEAAHCAREQGKYWEMHDLLFEKMRLWSGNLKAESIFNSFAKELKLDAKRFAGCLADNKYRDFVMSSVKEGVDADVEGTPTFFINGKKTFFGGYPIESFDAVLEKLGN